MSQRGMAWHVSDGFIIKKLFIYIRKNESNMPVGAAQRVLLLLFLKLLLFLLFLFFSFLCVVFVVASVIALSIFVVMPLYCLLSVLFFVVVQLLDSTVVSYVET